MSRNIRLLIVDDERHIREGLQMAFADAYDAEMDFAADGETASVLLRENRYDLVFSDDRLPGTRGIVLLENLRAGRYFDPRRLVGTPPRTPFIVGTGSASLSIEEIVLDLGGQHMEKPLNIIRLMALVRASLR